MNLGEPEFLFGPIPPRGDGVCQALWFRRVKAEKTLTEIKPGSAIGAVQFLLTNEEHTPFNWP
jgi:hypothetical protein